MRPGEYKIWGVLVVFALVLALFLALLPYQVTIEKSGIVSVTTRTAKAAAPPVCENITETFGDAVDWLTMSAPGDCVEGDLMIAWVTKDDNVAFSIPSGWTLIQARPDADNKGVYVSVSYRIFQTGDTSWNWTGDSGEDWYGVILRYTGHNSTNPINASDNASATDAAPIAPAVTTDTDNCTILYMFGADDDDIPYTVPGELTTLWNDSFITTGGAGGDKVLASKGDSGTATFGMNLAEEWVAVTVAIAPACSPNISNTPSSYDFGLVNESATYNTSLAYFNVTNNSTGLVNIDIQGTDMVGGTTWTLSDTATPGTNTYGLKAGTSGDGDYVTTVNKSGATFITNLADSDNTTWGLKIWIPITFTDGVSKTANVTLTVSCS